MRKAGRVLLVVCVVVAAVAGVAALLVIPHMVKESYHTWRDEALVKTQTESPYYGLSVFLQHYYPEVKTEILPNVAAFEEMADTQGAVMFVAGEDGVLDEEIRQELLVWVAGGNHVVLSAYAYNEQLFPELMLPLDLIGTREEDKAADPDSNDEGGARHARLAQNITPAVRARCRQDWDRIEQKYRPMLADDVQSGRDAFLQECPHYLSVLTLPEAAGRPVYVAGTDHRKAIVFHLDTAKVPVLMRADSAYGTTLVRVAYGLGTITLSNDSAIFAHPRTPVNFLADINRFDNAYLAAYLAQGKSRIFILNSLAKERFSSMRLPLWAQLAKQEPLLSLSLVLLLAGVLWHQARHLGGKRRYDIRGERQLAAHFAAQGQLVWRMKEQRAVLERLQQELWAGWQRKLAGYALTDQKQKINLIHRITGAAKADVALWLQPIPETVRRRDLLRYLRAHQRIRKST